MMNTHMAGGGGALKRKPEETQTNLPEAKKQRVGNFGGYHPDQIPTLPHAMEMFDQALNQHRAMKQQSSSVQMQYTQQQEAYDPYAQQMNQYSGMSQPQMYGYYQDQMNPYGGYAQQAQTPYMQPTYEPGAINTLHASGFPMGATEEDAKRLFSHHAGYIALNYVAKPQNVEYAAAAKAQTDGAIVYGKPIRVGYAKSEMKSRYTPTMGGGMGAAMGSYDMKSGYTGPSVPINTLYLTGLSHSTVENQIHDILKNQAGFLALSFVHKAGRAPHAFVLFSDPTSASTCKESIQGQMINGRPLRVQFAKSEMHRGVATSGPLAQQQPTM